MLKRRKIKGSELKTRSKEEKKEMEGRVKRREGRKVGLKP